MRYILVKPKMKVFDDEITFGHEIERFEELPERNQMSLINLGWVKAVADNKDEPTKERHRTKTTTKVRKKKSEENVKEGD